MGVFARPTSGRRAGELGHHRRSQAIGIMYGAAALFFFLIGGSRRC
jgi:hypothetical protein